MKHICLKIRPQFLNLIAKGVKKHEYRLNTPDKSQIKNGDRITFISNQGSSEIAIASVRRITFYESWEEALKDNWEEDFKGLYHSLDEVLRVCYKFYSRDLVKQYGIIKYDIEPLRRKLRDNRVLLDTNIIIQREGYNNVSFEVSCLYKWLEKLKSIKIICPSTKKEIQKYQNQAIRKSISIKLDSYEELIPHKFDDEYFNKVVNNFALDANSIIDNELLYQIYDGMADLLITNDYKMLKKAELLGLKDCVMSVDTYLKIVENEFPAKVDYKILSVKKELFGNIDSNDIFFDTLREDYPEFDEWFRSKNQDETYVFRTIDGVHGFLFVKVEDRNEPDYLKIVPQLPPKKRLKIGTFKIDLTLKGFRLGERFLKIIFDNAIKNKVDEIYVTLFENHRDEVDKLRNLLLKWGFYLWGYKGSSNETRESVFVKSLEKYDPSKGIKYNFPNLPSGKKMFILPINPEYHTQLFPDSILKTEDISLYSGNKAHLYSLEKIYVSGVSGKSAKPGDFVVIYRNGDRYPKRYSSVCTCLAVLEEIKCPKNLDEYLEECSNKSVFSKEELIDFYNTKKYRFVIKLIPYKTYFKKISLDELIGAGFVEYDSGPRPFDEVPERLYNMFLESR